MTTFDAAITTEVPVVRVADRINRSSRRAAMRFAVRHAAGVAGYHAARSHRYYGQIAKHAPRGTWEVTKGSWRWFTDSDGRAAYRQTLRANGGDQSSDSSVLARKQHDDTVRERLFISSLIGGGAVGLGLFGWSTMPAPELLQPITLGAGAFGVPLGLGLVGRPPGDPIVPPAQLSTELRKLSRGEIELALSALKIDPAQCLIGAVVAHKDGWRSEIDLPRTHKASDIVRKPEDLAAALARPEGTVWPEVGNIANRLVLRVSFQEMSQAEQQRWPLLDAERHDYFDRFPLAQNELGGVVDMTLASTNVAISGMPESGKTITVLVTIMGGVLDPRTELWLGELKGTGDYKALRPLASVYISGKRREQLFESLLMLRALNRECEERAARINEVSIEPKVTTVSANEEGLHPLVVVLDECQALFRDAEFGPEAVELASLIVEQSRALGVTLILSTQVPDAWSLPRSIMKKVRTRWCGEQEGDQGTDATLGTGSWREGARPQFGLPGMGILKGQHRKQLVTGRTFYVPSEDVVRFADRVLALRGGVVVQRLLEEPPEAELEVVRSTESSVSPSLVDDIWAVAQPTPGRIAEDPFNEFVIQTEPLCELLRRSAGDYAGLTPAKLRRRLTDELGLRSRQKNIEIDSETRSRRGWFLSDFRAALEVAA